MKTTQTLEFANWLNRLRDRKAKTKIAVRIVRVEAGNLGDVKSVGGKVSELRINYGPGYRVYFTIRGEELILLLCGGTKGTQAKDIERAQQMVADLG